MKLALRSSGVALVATLVFATTRPALATSARWAFETAYGDGEWYKDYNNETATLAWGESYVMMALAAMFRTTGDRAYLDRLAEHADAMMLQRDDARGVVDYREVSTACWRNTSYQTEPYCYVVHSGMIGYPIAELVRLIRATPAIADLTTYDGTSYAAKATTLLAALEEVVAAHDDQFVADGAAGDYIFRTDATFLTYAGSAMPLNQQNAMGRLLLVLYQITAAPAYLDKAERLARRFRGALTTGGNGEYLWNYWGGTYAAPGEDISHAAINVGFAVRAAAAGVEFTAADLEAFARTFVFNVYRDDATLANNVGGGGVNGASYKPQAGRWVALAAQRALVYQAVRNYYDSAIDPASVTSGSVLLGWAYLAEHRPPLCEHFFYYVDWQDHTSYMQASAQNANILTTPPDPTQSCMVPVELASQRLVTVAQYDGSQYHANAVWQSTAGAFAKRLLAYEPRYHSEYWNGGDLYQFEDAFVSGEGVQVMLPRGRTPPEITSSPRLAGAIGVAYSYDADGLPEATGEPPLWWSIESGPAAARADPTGHIHWTPAAAGTFELVLRVDNDLGFARQTFDVEVVDPLRPDAGPTDGDASPSLDGGSGDGGGGFDNSAGGCACSAGDRRGGAGLIALGLVVAALLRGRRKSWRRV